MKLARAAIVGLIASLGLPGVAFAGPPYFSDDPEPTDYQHFEIYTFTNGTHVRGDTAGASGIDFNYGGAPDLQLTAVIPFVYDAPAGAKTVSGLGNVELGAKYRFLHQDDIGWDVSIFPRVFLPAGNKAVGESHASVLIPLWLEKDWDKWSTFGGGGCVINRGGVSQDYCIMGWTLARQVLPELQIGAEVYHQTPDSHGARQSTSVGVGARYDLSENLHLLGYLSRGVQNPTQTNQLSWYASVLFSF